MNRRSPSAGLAAAALVLAACGGSVPVGSPTPTSTTAGTTPTPPVPSVAPSIATAAAPICPGLRPPWVTASGHPSDGVQDPAGTIVFGQINREDEIIGQVIAPIFSMDADGTDLVQVFSCELERPRISPDGSRIAFSIAMDDQTWQVATIAADGSDLRILTSTAGYAETPDWSPDGTWLIYAQSPVQCSREPICDSLRESLWRMNADGSDQRELGSKPADAWDWEPRLSRDGTQVVFVRSEPADGYLWHIMIRDLVSGTERVVRPETRDVEHPDWSPDGRFIVYNVTPSGPIERIPVDDPTAPPVVLAGDADHPVFKPVYSPDGSSIAFGCGANVCRMNADGSNVSVLVEAAGVEFNHFDWGLSAAGG